MRGVFQFGFYPIKDRSSRNKAPRLFLHIYEARSLPSAVNNFQNTFILVIPRCNCDFGYMNIVTLVSLSLSLNKFIQKHKRAYSRGVITEIGIYVLLPLSSVAWNR